MRRRQKGVVEWVSTPSLDTGWYQLCILGRNGPRFCASSDDISKGTKPFGVGDTVMFLWEKDTTFPHNISYNAHNVKKAKHALDYVSLEVLGKSEQSQADYSIYFRYIPYEECKACKKVGQWQECYGKYTADLSSEAQNRRICGHCQTEKGKPLEDRWLPKVAKEIRKQIIKAMKNI